MRFSRYVFRLSASRPDPEVSSRARAAGRLLRIRPVFPAWFALLDPGSRLFSHTVSSAVPSAAYGLTGVFGMGTGVSRKRITTRKDRALMTQQ